MAIGGIKLNNLESVKQTGVEIILINGISGAISPQQAFYRIRNDGKNSGCIKIVMVEPEIPGNTGNIIRLCTKLVPNYIWLALWVF